MTRLTWSDRDYYAGVDRGAIYFRGGEVEVWNGLIKVDEAPTDIRERVRYRDGRRTVNQRAEDAFAASVDCFSYPERLNAYGVVFDMSYRVKKSTGYEIHLVYNAMPRISGVKYAQRESSPLTVDLVTKPRAMPLLRAPSAHVIIDTELAYPPVVVEFEKLLYGEEHTNPRFPNPEELVDIFDVNALFQVVDNGDGTATISAPDEVFDWLTSTHAIVDWPYVNNVDSDTVRIRNW